MPRNQLAAWFLGSGSQGNCSLISFNRRTILVDAGFSCRKLLAFLEENEVDPSMLSGIVLSHDHNDHVKGLKLFLNKYSVPVYATRGTLEKLKSRGVSIQWPFIIRSEREIVIDGISCRPFEVPHDAAEPVGFRFEYSGGVVAIATDLGHITPRVMEHVSGSDILCIESNYDLEMLKSCSYPGWLKHRIASPLGHLPNRSVHGVLTRLRRLPRHLVLAHISQDSNTPELVAKNLAPLVESGALASTTITIIDQDKSSRRLVCSIEREKLGRARVEPLWVQTTFDFASPIRAFK